MNDLKVSFDDEKLVMVNDNNEVLGYKDKVACHLDKGILHRAFSILIFNEKKELLLQKRSKDKMLWPLYWSNSCCSHPRKGEVFEAALQRRLKEELGITVKLQYLYNFQYYAEYLKTGVEKELCSVYIGKYIGELNINKNEIDEVKYISIDQLEKELVEQADNYTPWFKMEWEQIKKNHFKTVEKLFL